jgi:hypothetical protein
MSDEERKWIKLESIPATRCIRPNSIRLLPYPTCAFLPEIPLHDFRSSDPQFTQTAPPKLELEAVEVFGCPVRRWQDG